MGPAAVQVPELTTGPAGLEGPALQTSGPAGRVFPVAAILEGVSKGATVLSVLLIVLLELGLNLDITWMLRGLAALAIVIGWTLASVSPMSAGALWLFVAPAAPAILGRLAHREGPVVDLVWMAGLAATLIRTTNWSRWELPRSWKPLVGGWALMLSLAWPVIAARELAFDPGLLTDTGAVNSWAGLSAPQVFAWVLYVALTQLLGALWLDTLVQRAARDRAQLARVVMALGAGVTISSLVAIFQGAVRFQFLSTEAWASLHRATGTMMDANAYGAIAAMAAPLAFLALRARQTRHATAAGLVVLGINFAGMWMSGSRTAVLVGCGGVAGLIAAAALTQSGRARRVVPAVLALAALLGVAVASRSSAIGPVERLRELPGSTTSALSSLWTRQGYGTVAIEMIREHPMIGVGLGTYHVIAPDYWRRDTATLLPFDNAQNWWRHQAAELGLLGGLAIIVWSLAAGWVLLFGRVRPNWRFTAVTLRGIVAGVAACSMLGMPTQNPLVLLTFMLAIAWLAAAVVAPELPLLARAPSAAWTVVCVMAVAYAAGHLWVGHQSLSVMARAVRASREYIVGSYPAEVLPKVSEFRWTRQQATFVWPARTRVLVLHLWARNPDLGTRPLQVSLSTPCGEVFNGALQSPDPVELAFQVPPGQPAVAATLRVSRTWRPAEVDQASTDRRSLGAAVWKDWLPADEAAEVPVRALPACQTGS